MLLYNLEHSFQISILSRANEANCSLLNGPTLPGLKGLRSSIYRLVSFDKDINQGLCIPEHRSSDNL